MKCHYIYTETGEKVLIPGCMGTAAMGIEHCTDRLQEKLGLLDEAVKELKEALINAQESLGMSIAEFERAIEQISRLGAECLMAQVIERSLEYELKKISLEDYEICSEPAERNPYPPYRERLHPRKHWQRKPYWLRTRSNPKKKGYH